MDVTAKDISEWCLAEIDRLIKSGLFASHWEIYRVVAGAAGVSAQRIRQFHRGENSNLSAATLDNVVAALKSIQQRLRAA